MAKDTGVVPVPARAAVGIAAAACIGLAMTVFVYLRAADGADDGVDSRAIAPASASSVAAAAQGVISASAAQPPLAAPLDNSMPVDQREGVAVISRARPDAQSARTRGRRDEGREPARYVPAAELAQGR